MRYALALLAFAAALTGVLGDTHDSARPGLAGVTSLGWAAILVAALSFLIILIATYRDHAKMNWQTRQRAKVRCIANQQVAEAVMHLLNPFHEFLRELALPPERSGLEIDLNRVDNASYIIDQLFRPAVRVEFWAVDLRAKPNVHPPLLWWEYFARSASEARELLNQAAAKYSGYLEPDILVGIEQVRADELVCFRLPTLGELESDNSHIVPLPLCDAFGPIEPDRNLDAMLKKLRAVLDHVSSDDMPNKRARAPSGTSLQRL
jgi:hypothetical protein